MKKIKVGIIFGGRSPEHEVSLQSAKNVLQALDRDKYEAVPIGIDKQGRWHIYDEATYLLHEQNPKLIKLNQSTEDVAVVTAGDHGALINARSGGVVTGVDVAFPVLHGRFGEDGTVQGLLAMADIPFVGPGVLASAMCMDKEVTKRLLTAAGIPNANYAIVYPQQTLSFAEASARLKVPLFVKPANLGSSVGIKKVATAEAYEAALAEAFRYDRKVLIEEYIKGREIECAVLGNEDPRASLPGEIVTTHGHEFYSYEAKYIDPEGADLIAPADLPAVVKRRVQELAVKAFRTLECEGMARVDFFVGGDGADQIYVNEINTIPGFTKISMYPRLWEVSGLGYTNLISMLIELAQERFAREKKLETNL